ncbi:transketolase [Alphaproteobacteria bacterium]|nr:transketolase [Alphaproteobacteria bacterium]
MQIKTSTSENKDALRLSKERCRNYRRRVLELSQQVSALHVAPAFSCMEIVDLIYNVLMAPRPKSAPQDTFVMSKGHGYMGQAVILEEMGVLQKKDLDDYCKPEGRLGAHPDYGVPGIEATTGSLGHGFGLAVGMAAADIIKGEDRKIFVIIGDGELQEGSCWEAITMAPNLNLSNLTVFLDLNDYQGLGRTSESHPFFNPVSEKVRSFGWASEETDGHDVKDMMSALDKCAGDKPTFIVCHTVKGKGVSYMQNNPIWHYRSPNMEEYEMALAELEDSK